VKVSASGEESTTGLEHLNGITRMSGQSLASILLARVLGIERGFDTSILGIGPRGLDELDARIDIVLFRRSLVRRNERLNRDLLRRSRSFSSRRTLSHRTPNLSGK